MDEIYKDVADVVMERMEVNYYDMLTSNEQRFVDARAMLARALSGRGMNQKVIASMMGLTRQGVNKLINGFDDRVRYSFTLRKAWDDISNEVATR